MLTVFLLPVVIGAYSLTSHWCLYIRFTGMDLMNYLTTLQDFDFFALFLFTSIISRGSFISVKLLGIKGTKFLDSIHDCKFEVLQGTWLLQGNLTNIRFVASDSYNPPDLADIYFT
jgi:hypothetical protein